jgi:hypothetical protein
MSVKTVQMIRAKVKPEHVADVDSAVHDVFAALEANPPRGLRFASSKMSDGVTYFVLVGLEDGTPNPLPAVPAYQKFLAGLQKWLAEQPGQDQLTLVGSYNLF